MALDYVLGMLRTLEPLLSEAIHHPYGRRAIDRNPDYGRSNDAQFERLSATQGCGEVLVGGGHDAQTRWRSS